MLNSFSWLEWRKSKPNGRAALCLSAADYISSWEMLLGVAKYHTNVWERRRARQEHIESIRSAETGNDANAVFLHCMPCTMPDELL
jgi:hypothetical protein